MRAMEIGQKDSREKIKTIDKYVYIKCMKVDGPRYV